MKLSQQSPERRHTTTPIGALGAARRVGAITTARPGTTPAGTGVGRECAGAAGAAGGASIAPIASGVVPSPAPPACAPAPSAPVAPVSAGDGVAPVAPVSAVRTAPVTPVSVHGAAWSRRAAASRAAAVAPVASTNRHARPAGLRIGPVVRVCTRRTERARHQRYGILDVARVDGAGVRPRAKAVFVAVLHLHLYVTVSVRHVEAVRLHIAQSGRSAVGPVLARLPLAKLCFVDGRRAGGHGACRPGRIYLKRVGAGRAWRRPLVR